MDDTHAIVIFSDEVTAAKSLTIKDTQIKFKPFYQACEASKSKAKGFNIEIESGSVRSRPDTTTVIAKRLLSRALNNPEIQASPQDVNLLQQAKTCKSTNNGKEWNVLTSFFLLFSGTGCWCFWALNNSEKQASPQDVNLLQQAKIY